VKKLHIAASPLTGTIFAGHVLKDGRTWGKGKQDLTSEALIAVAEHAIHFGGKTGKAIKVSDDYGKLIYTIKVSKER